MTEAAAPVRARVVLVHGLRTSASMWRGQTPLLAPYGVDAIALDLPGHGSRMAEPFAVDAALDAIGAAVEAARSPTVPTGIARPVPVLLVGLSLGGYLSIEFAARHPEAIDGLVAASCGTRPRGAGLAGYRMLARAIARLPDRGRRLNELTARLVLAPAAVRDVVAGGVALDVMAPALTGIGALDLEGALHRYPGPVWFVNGRFDHFRAEERRLLRAAPDGRLVVVPGATHLVSLARPEGFAAVLLGAVAELERRSAAARSRLGA